MNRCLACTVALLLPGAAAGQEAPAIPCQWSGVQRVVAVGDVHGAYEQFVQILKAARVVDERLHWMAGETHLVQTGDIPDRGADSKKAFDLLRRLEEEAAAAGGRVHALIGNHEAMMIQGDYRYLHPADLEAYVTPDSGKRREEFLRAHPRLSPLQVPLGWVEHRAAFAPDGQYGAWILRHNAVIKVNDTLFLHGGLSRKFGAMPLARLNEKVRAELRQKLTPRTVYPVVDDPLGPLWYRGYGLERESVLEPVVKKVLEFHQVSRIVVGHTVTGGRIERRCGGRILLIDCGMNPLYEGGRPAALELKGGDPREIYASEKGNP